MPPEMTNEIKREVLKYVKRQSTPTPLETMAKDLRDQHESFRPLPDSEFRAVVQPMIVTGKLSYTPGLKIKLGGTVR